MTKSRFLPVLMTGIAGLILSSCSASRDLPEGQVMLNKVSVVADGKYSDVNPSQLKNYVRQKGNSRWFYGRRRHYEMDKQDTQEYG